MTVEKHEIRDTTEECKEIHRFTEEGRTGKAKEDCTENRCFLKGFVLYFLNSLLIFIRWMFSDSEQNAAKID